MRVGKVKRLESEVEERDRIIDRFAKVLGPAYDVSTPPPPPTLAESNARSDSYFVSQFAV